jgi:hypothetical protein
MNIYIIHGARSYGNGMAVVAATSPGRAKAALMATGSPWDDPNWGLEITRCSAIRNASVERQTTAVLSQSNYIE